MYIDDFIWLPDIIEKLTFKHQMAQDEVEEVFFNNPAFALSKKEIVLVKMCTQQPGKLMQEDMSLYFLSKSHKILP